MSSPPPGGPFPPQYGSGGPPPPVFPPAYGPGPGGPGGPPPFGPPGPPPPSGGGGIAIVLIVGAVVLALVVAGGAYLLLSGDDGDGTTLAGRPATALPTAGRITGSPGPTLPTQPSTKAKVTIRAGFFGTPVRAGSGTYRRSGAWTRTCIAAAKPRLAAMLRGSRCSSMLRGATYQAPDRRTYVQITLMEFATTERARRMSAAVNADTAPVIRVARGAEPGHWWSSSYVGRHVLVRQSFVNESSATGSRSGPAQTYGDQLIRKFHAELSSAYIRN